MCFKCKAIGLAPFYFLAIIAISVLLSFKGLYAGAKKVVGHVIQNDYSEGRRK